MKVTKIDFTTEVMEIPDGERERRFVKYDPRMYEVQSFGADITQDFSHYEDMIYRVEKVRTPDGAHGILPCQDWRETIGRNFVPYQ